MELFKSVWSVAAINFVRWLKDRRVRFLFVCAGILVCYYVWPFTAYGLATDQKCSIWVLPLLFKSGAISVSLTKTIFHCGMLLLLCDAPFFSPVTPYMVLRSRRRGWWIGECLYIMLASLVYLLFLTVVSIVVLLPVASFGNDWGGVMYDMTFGKDGLTNIEVALEHNFKVLLPVDVFRFLYPQGAQLYSFFALWCSFSFVGLLTYLLSLASRKIVLGMGISAVFIFLDPFLVWIWTNSSFEWVELLSPVCWASIDRIQITDRLNFMSIPMVAGLYAAIILVLIVTIWRVSMRTEIDAGVK